MVQCIVSTEYIVHCAVWWWKSIDRTSGLDRWHWPTHFDCKVYIKQPLLQKENQENNFQTILNMEVLRSIRFWNWSLTLTKKNMFHDGTHSIHMNVPEATDKRGLIHAFFSLYFWQQKSAACFLTRTDVIWQKVRYWWWSYEVLKQISIWGFSASNQVHVHVLCRFKGDQGHRS